MVITIYLSERNRADHPETGMLCYRVESAGERVLTDTRSDATEKEIRLSGFQQAVYEYCDERKSFHVIGQYLRRKYPQNELGGGKLREFLDRLVVNR